MKKREEYICPKCKHKNKIIIQDTCTEKDVSSIIKKDIFFNACKKCGENIFIEYPFKVEGTNYIVYYTPGKTEEIVDDTKEIRRICDTFDDLKEKLLILEDNLDDIKIEFIKSFIKDALDYDTKKDMITLRYNNKDNNTLIFRIIGLDKFVAFSITNYQELDKKIRLKKIKKCVLIDEYTYKKYYRMRIL